MSGDHPYYCIIEVGQNTEKSPGDLSKLIFTQTAVQVLSIPVLLLACSQDWTCNLQMIVSWEA